ncbi:unnamed protein product [Rhodiola kirilowii]
MVPKRYFAPLAALSVVALALSSFYYSTLPAGFNARSDFELVHRRNPSFTFIIKLLAYDRFESIARCLKSLGRAEYGSDVVHLHVYVDHFPVADPPGGDVDEKLRNARRILDLVDGFEWKFGEKIVHYRTMNAGLQAQWLEAWWPSSNDEFVFVVEDDLEVSTLYYKFLKRVIEHYYYNASNYSPWVYGASLQRPRFVPGKHGNKIQLSGDTRLFLYQIVGTWGQLLFPRPWKEFRLWYDLHKVKGIKPVLEGMVTTGWYKKLGERIWTPWFIKFIHSRSYYNIYTNFQHERALSISHRDAGVNYRKTDGPDSILLDKQNLDFDLLEMKSLSTLKWYDFCFKEVTPGRIIRSLTELGSVISSVQKQETVIFVSTFHVPANVIKNMLCHFEKQNIQNYIIIGSDSDMVLDLSRRGHPIIDANQFYASIRTDKSVDTAASNVNRVQEILVKAYIVKKCVELRYNSLLVDASILPNNSNWYTEFIASTPDILAGKTTELFFVRASSSSRTIWDDILMHQAVAAANSLAVKASSSTDERSFKQTIVSLLEHKGVRVTRLDEETIGTRVDVYNVSKTSSAGRDNLFYLSSGSDFNLVQKTLEELRLWIIDDESSCTAVFCHPS